MSKVIPVDDEERQLLSHEETIELIKEAQEGKQESKTTLVKRNTALVKSIVKKFLGRGHEYEDLFQLGVIGLIKAIHNYDPKYQVRFSTYAVPMIMGEIKRFLRDDGMIKVSRSLKELASKALNAKEQLKMKLQREPTIQEVAEYISTPAEEIVYALEAARTHSSIYDVIYEEDDNPILLIDKMAEEDNQVAKIVDRVTLKDLLSRLDKRERAIIIMRYFQDKTQNDIAELLGISQVQVSRIEKKVLLKMREMM